MAVINDPKLMVGFGESTTRSFLNSLKLAFVYLMTRNLSKQFVPMPTLVHMRKDFTSVNTNPISLVHSCCFHRRLLYACIN